MSATDRALVAVQLDPRRAAAVVDEVWECGGAVMPLDPSLPSSAAESLARRYGAAVLIHPGGALDLDPVPEDLELGAVVFTSGTTGAPKAVELTKTALQRAAVLSNAALGAEAGDRWLCCLPVHHIAGLGILARARALGAPPLVLDRFEVDAVATADARFVSLVPTTLGRLLDAGVALDGFGAILLGGAAIPAGLIERAEGRGARVVRSYGMTETCGGVVYDGLPLPGVRLRVGDVEFPDNASSEHHGAIAISSPTLMRGYRGAEPRASEWFETSDLGTMRGGRLEVVGRADDIIITGGEKVAPARVEDVLMSLPGVKDALVVGVEDREWGQRVVAFVVAPGADPGDLRDAVRSRLLAHEAPKDLVLVQDIPRTSSGKPQQQWVQAKAPG
ncbi:MAG: AMP-binding protein [Actinomycetota bacterium]